VTPTARTIHLGEALLFIISLVPQLSAKNLDLIVNTS
jgi:hypothetical protein